MKTGCREDEKCPLKGRKSNTGPLTGLVFNSARTV